MLVIALAEAALRLNFVFWSYFVVIFQVGVDVLYRIATVRQVSYLQNLSLSHVYFRRT